MMRNLRKRRKLIRQMEQANKIPDKLMPQEIKDMLDVAGFRPVIENTPNSAEIKINSGRSNALRCLAVVAAFVLVVGGFAVLRFSNTQFVNTRVTVHLLIDIDADTRQIGKKHYTEYTIS